MALGNVGTQRPFSSQGIPAAATIRVQMGAEHVVDLFRRDARGTQPLQERQVERMKPRDPALLVVAGAAVDQDGAGCRVRITQVWMLAMNLPSASLK